MIHSTFGVPFFVSNIDSKKIKFKKENFKKTEEWISKTVSSFNFKNTLTEDSEKYLLKKIIENLDELYKKPYEIRIESIWTNKYLNKDYQEPHIHPGSVYSFIIYKKVGKSKSYFVSPYQDLIISYQVADIFEETKRIECKDNQMIIFPSFVKHGVSASSNNETIAGNLIFKFKKI
jgi:hypothetical protein